jgi:hypothetical protein
MRLKHSMERVHQAEQLYCVNGLSVHRVASQLGISERTVRYWTLKHGWEEKRDQVREALSRLRTDTILLRARLLEKCMTSLSPQDALAFVSLESAADKRGQAAADNCLDPVPEGLCEISSLDDVIAALNDAITVKLNRFLADPGPLGFAAMRDLIKVIDMVRGMESRQARLRGESEDPRPALS